MFYQPNGTEIIEGLLEELNESGLSYACHSPEFYIEAEIDARYGDSYWEYLPSDKKQKLIERFRKAALKALEPPKEKPPLPSVVKRQLTFNFGG